MTNALPDHLRPSEAPLPRRFRLGRVFLAVVPLVMIAGVLYYLFWPLDAPIPAGVKTHYSGIERGFTEDGYAYLGRAGAPNVIEYFSSYACPHCREFHEGPFDDLLDEIAAGQVQFIMIPVPHIGPGARTAARAAYCAGEQDQFWEMSDVLFGWQERYTLRAFDERRIRKGAAGLGLDQAAFEACMDQKRPEGVIERAREEFDRRGASGTPTFFLNGKKVEDYAELESLNTMQSDEG